MVRHVPLKEAADRNYAICFLFLRDIDSCEGSYGSLRRIPVGLSRSGMLCHLTESFSQPVPRAAAQPYTHARIRADRHQGRLRAARGLPKRIHPQLGDGGTRARAPPRLDARGGGLLHARAVDMQQRGGDERIDLSRTARAASRRRAARRTAEGSARSWSPRRASNLLARVLARVFARVFARVLRAFSARIPARAPESKRAAGRRPPRARAARCWRSTTRGRPARGAPRAAP